MDDVNEKSVEPTPGLGFKVLGGVCIAASAAIGFFSSVSLSQSLARAWKRRSLKKTARTFVFKWLGLFISAQ